MIVSEWHGLKPGMATVPEIENVLGRPDREASGVTYGSVQDLELFSYDDRAASLLLRDGKVLIIILVPKESDGFPRLSADWLAAFGPPALKLPSSKGKNHRVFVYSQYGLAATVDGTHVTLVELFPPTQPEQYERTFYKKPPVFIK